MHQSQEEIFLEALDAYKDRLYRVCKAYASTENDAQDLFQDVVLQVWKALPGFKGQAALSTWMYRIALNVCLQATYKAANKAKHVRLEGIYLETVQHEEPNVALEQKHQALHHCIQHLNDSDRSVIVLFLEDLPYKEIAIITGLSENHVAVKVKRIKAKLLTCLTK